MGRFMKVCLWWLVTTSLIAGPPVIEIPSEIRPSGDYARLTPKTDAVAISYVGLSGIDPFPSEDLKDPRRFLLPVRGLPVGKYRFAAIGTKGDEQTRQDFVVVVGDAPPTPPVPPGPTPPVPPGPTPPDELPVTNPRVLIVYETGQTVTPGQHSAMYGNRVAEFLNSKCAAGADGVKEWRVWDRDLNLSTAPKGWQEMMNRPRTAVPWLVIAGSGRLAYEGALPKTVDETLTLLKKYLGN
jgi:hypothetical protein